MHVLYEEDGDFKAATVLSEQDASLQVESASGKRSKIKRTAVLLSFKAPEPSEFVQQAKTQAEDLDLDFLWECAPQEEFDFRDLAREYFGATPSAVELAALLMRLHGAPAYFYRKGRGHYRPAPEETLKAALAALEKRRLQTEQQQRWTGALVAGELPEAIRALAAKLLFAPDKQSLEFKALEAAANQLQKTPLRILLDLGAFAGPYALHRARFLLECFPRGTGFPEIDEALLDARAAQEIASLPLAPAPAFSIDDVTTTEIDDAFSVCWLNDSSVRVGIHIAVPALSVHRDDPVDRIARQRLSTVYMPGDKITMLPDALVQRFSLAAGHEHASMSLYFTVSTDDWKPRDFESKVERVMIEHNLRHSEIEHLMTEDDLRAEGAQALASGVPHARSLAVLFKVATVLLKERERVRGKPEPKGRADYNFYVDWAENGPETGEGVVRIERRQRGAPLDLLVAELMILANCHWGGWLHEKRAMAIYRAQSFGRVKMQTQAAPHEGMGVPQYAWCTSPLRRYVDLINQMQLVGLILRGQAAFPSNDADVFAIVSNFDATYAQYASFQQQMERYWCLRWLKQESAQRELAHAMKEDLFRLARLPLVVRVPQAPNLARGAGVLVDLIDLDEVDIVAHVRLAQIVEEPEPTSLDDEDSLS